MAVMGALLAACGASEEAPASAAALVGYAAAAAAMDAAQWSPGQERQVATLLSGLPVNPDALNDVLADVRPTLGALDAALDAPWTLPPPGAPRVSRDDWEAMAWLAYGDARLALDRGDEALAGRRVALAGRLANRLAGAEGAALGDLVIAFGLAEAGALQAQRLAVLAPGAAEAPAPIPNAAWRAALRAEAVAATGRIEAMADDPAGGLGLAGDALPEGAADASPKDLLDTPAAQDAAVGLFLAASERTLADCAAPLMLPETLAPARDQPNAAGRVMLGELGTALTRVDDRRCLTEAARRAAALAVMLHRAAGGGALPTALPDAPALADPFTGRPFAYDPAGGTIRSAGRDRRLAASPGHGPFDDDEPTWYLDLRPLI